MNTNIVKYTETETLSNAVIDFVSSSQCRTPANLLGQLRQVGTVSLYGGSATRL